MPTTPEPTAMPTTANPTASPTTEPTRPRDHPDWPDNRSPAPTSSTASPTATPTTATPTIAPTARPTSTRKHPDWVAPTKKPTAAPTVPVPTTEKPTPYFKNPNKTSKPTPYFQNPNKTKAPTTPPTARPTRRPPRTPKPTPSLQEKLEALGERLTSCIVPMHNIDGLLDGRRTGKPTTSPRPSKEPRRRTKAPTASPKPSRSSRPSREPRTTFPEIPADFSTQFPDKSITQQLATKVMGYWHGCTDTLDSSITFEYELSAFNGLDAAVVTFVPEEEPDKKYAVLAFKGSDEAADWVTNLNFFFEETNPDRFGPEGMAVHGGYYDIIWSKRFGCNLVKETLKLINGDRDEGIEGYEKMLYVVGYSAGGM